MGSQRFWSGTKLFPKLISEFLKLGYGFGIRDQKSTPYKVCPSNSKIKLILLKIMDNVTYMSCGHNFSTCVTREGRVWSWGVYMRLVIDHLSIIGLNDEGQLGNGSLANAVVPTVIDCQAFDGVKLIKVACGWDFTLALSDKGHVYAWGTPPSHCHVQIADSV